MKKRITALLLAFAMLFTLSAAALAADESALVPEPAAAEPAAETPTPLPEAAEDKTEAPAEQLAAPRPVLRAVETAATHTPHPYCGDKTCEDHGEAITEWNDLNAVPAGRTLEAGKAYYLTDDLSINSAFVVSSGEVNVCLNGYTLSFPNNTNYQRVFDIKGGTLRICDCSTNQSGTLASNAQGTGAVVFLRGGSGTPAFELYGGTLTSTGGKTANTTAPKQGGAVYMNSGSFTMYGGTISGCSAGKGGGVYLVAGSFTMEGGTISGCSAGKGGGVYLASGTFTMESGTISDCTTTGNGGGVYISKGTFSMGGGLITECSAVNGGGIAFMENKTDSVSFNMTAGEIYKNHATGNGGGVAFWYHPFQMSGGKIRENTAGSNGGGVQFWGDTANTIMTFTGGEISKNEAKGVGGGIKVGGGTSTLKLGGEAILRDNTNTSSTNVAPNLHGESTSTISLTAALTGDADIYSTAAVSIAGSLTEWTDYATWDVGTEHRFRAPADQTITIDEGEHTIIRNGVAQSIDFAHAEGAITYALDGTYTGVTLGAENKTLTADSTAQLGETVKIKVTAEATENYKEANKFFEVTIVDRKSKSLTVTMENWTYGETKEPTVTGLPEGVELSNTVISYTDKDDNPVTNPTNVGSYTVTVTYTTDNEVYSGGTGFLIVAKQITPPEADGRTFTYNGEDQTYTLATSAYYDISNNATQKNAGTYTITVSLKDTQNTCWDDGTMAAKNYTFKIETLKVDVPAADTATFTYTGQPQTYTVGGFNETYCEVRGNVQTNAGDHTVTVSLKDTANTEWKTGGTADKTYTFTIAQAKLTLRALDKKITAGQPAPDLSNPVLNEDYTVEGTLYGSDTLDITMAYDPADTSKAGTYTITIAAAAMANYDITTVPGTLTVEAVQTSQKLGISTPPRTPGGTLELSPKNAKPGDTVTITVKPDKGFDLGGLTVRDVNGDKLDLVREGDNEFSFTMPKSSVKISASFVAENDDVLFRDVPTGAYFYDAVKWARQNGITDGIGDGLFGAAFPCTRAQIVTFLWRAAGSPEPQNDVTFADVPGSAYYAKAVAWAVEESITNGVGGNKFDPDAPCTRAQAVAFLYRAAGEPAVRSAADFDDVAENSYYAVAVAWAQRQSITDGVTPTRFAPDDDCTRAQIVTFLYRAFAE